MSVWKNPTEQLPPESTDVIVWVAGIYCVASWCPVDGGWCCAEWDDTEDADYVDLWTEIPDLDIDGRPSARQGTTP